jgi:hypothetical protein
VCTKVFTQRVHAIPQLWLRVAFAGTKQVYHTSIEPVFYIVPVTSIFGRLALVPVGEY